MNGLSACPICEITEGLALPSPLTQKSVTTSSVVLDLPLQRVQCPECGLLRRRTIITNKDELYRDRYADYYRRPGTSESERVRYATMARWLLEPLGQDRPAAIFDVGCGSGLLLQALSELQPGATYSGIDPSVENTEQARALGFAVVTGGLPGTALPPSSQELVVTVNVLQHIEEPVGFLAALAALGTEDGHVAILCPDGTSPNADMLYVDQPYSYLPVQVEAVAQRVGLARSALRAAAPPAGLADKQLLYVGHGGSGGNGAPNKALSVSERQELFERRVAYLTAWQELARRLSARAQGRTVFNFGASMWTILLATYCPAYWAQVEACVVDGGSGTFLGKPIVSAHDLDAVQKPLVVLGTNPSSQTVLAERLAARAEVLAWNDLIAQ